MMKHNLEILHRSLATGVSSPSHPYPGTLCFRGRKTGKTTLIVHSAIVQSLLNPDITTVVIVKDQWQRREITHLIRMVAEEHYDLDTKVSSFRIFLRDWGEFNKTHGIKVLAAAERGADIRGYKVHPHDIVYFDMGEYAMMMPAEEVWKLT